MTVVTVAGWIHLLHSFSIVNRNQLFWLGKDPNIDLYVIEPDPAKPSWGDHLIDPWWDEESRDFFLNLRFVTEPIKSGILLDYSYPFDYVKKFDGPWFRFVVTEFGLLRSNFVKKHEPLTYFEQPNMTILTPSKWSAQRLISTGVSSEKIRIIPHGFNPSIFYPASRSEKYSFRENLGLSDDHFVILNLGALTWNKGVDILVKAFVKLALDYPKAILILKDQVNLYGISGTKFIGELFERHNLPLDVIGQIRVISSDLNDNQLRSLYCAANIYVSPYRAEGFNLPVLEAMACDCSVLVSDGGATNDFVTPIGRVNADKVPLESLPPALLEDLISSQGHFLETSVQALYERLCNSIKDGGAIKSLAGIRDNYSWKSIVEKISLFH
jgi:glycosyltransferase involved in cell wall biosynthesis